MLPGEAAQRGTFNQSPQGTHGQIPANAINAHFHTEGARGVIALAPRMTKRTIKQGYTSTGEKILYIQHLGENHAHFVVEMHDGRW